MTLRVSLVIDGSAAGGKRAAEEVARAIGGVEQATQSARDEFGRFVTAGTSGSERIAAAMSATQQRINQAAGVRDPATEARRRDIEAYGSALDGLRARFNPLFAAQIEYREQLKDIDRAHAVGAISEGERAAARAREKEAFATQVVALNSTARSAGLARHEMVNLGRQAQDVAVSLAGGQSPLMVLMQQGAQIGDIFATSQGSVRGFLGQMATGLGSVVTPARLVAGGVLAIGAAALLAATQWSEGQRQVEASLLGVGRASGATRDDINRIAADAASVFGLSRSEARAFASELAATGKVGRENIAGIVALGKDVARVYGIDAADAAKLLAQAYADPVKGAEELNRRLGSFDAATVRTIANLTAQNRLMEAQQVLSKGIQDGVAGVGQTVATTTRFWTALGNVISNAWDRVGEFASRTTGIGFMPGLEEQIERTKVRIAELEQLAARRSDSVNRSLGTTAAIERERQELQRLTGQWEQYWRSVEEAQRRRDSFAGSAAVLRQLPEVGQRETLQNDLFVLDALMRQAQQTGGASLRALGVSWDQLTEAIARNRAALAGLKTEAERATEANAIALRALTAFSPAQKAEIGYLQAKHELQSAVMSDADKERIARERGNIALQQATVALSEARRERELSARQSAESAQLEIDMIGRTAGEQARLRADLAARHQLEQEAARNRTVFNQAEFEQLQRINAEMGRRVQLAAQLRLQSDVRFETDTLFMSDTDRTIASRLRSTFGDDWRSQMDGALATQMRFNETMRTTRDLLQDVALGFSRDFREQLRQGAEGWEAFSQAGLNALNRLADRLADIAMQGLFNRAFGGLVGAIGGGSTASLGFGGTNPFSGLGDVGQAGSSIAIGMHGGGISGVDRPSFRRVVDASFFAGAPRFHNGRLPWDPTFERPAILRNDEGVFTPAQMRAMGSGARQIDITVNVQGTGDKELMARMEAGTHAAVRQALITYDKALPTRVHRITGDPRAR